MKKLIFTALALATVVGASAQEKKEYRIATCCFLVRNTVMSYPRSCL